MAIHVTLIRHGQTDWNVIGRWQGVAPVPLNDNGRQQAREAAPHLKNAGITRIISSDLSRARETAEIIAATLNLPVQVDERWREIDLGRWQGLNLDEISTWDAESHRVFRQSDFIERAFPEGEDQRQHIARVSTGLDALAGAYPDEHVLVATHGGSIRCAAYHITGKVYQHITGNCSLTRLHRDDSGTWHMLGIAEAAAEVQW